MSITVLLDYYPDLEKEDFLACIAYAAKLTNVNSVYQVAWRFIVDVQLPRSLLLLINQFAYDSIHTLDMENKNSTSDTTNYK